MKKLLFALLLLVSFQLHSQKFAAYGTLGFYSSVSIELNCATFKEDKFKFNLSMGAGILSEYNFLREGNMSHIAGHFLAGNGKHFVEVRLGYTRFSEFKAWEFDEEGFFPLASLGYRYEKGAALFRAGFGVPEAAYFGVGVKF